MTGRFSRIAIAVVALLAVLVMVACTQSQVITTLKVVVNAVSLALPAVEQATGMTAEKRTEVDGYLAAVSTAVTKSDEILSGDGTAAQKSAQIVAAYAGIASPVLPAGTPAEVAETVSKVSSAVADLLTNFTQKSAAARGGGQMLLSARDRAGLEEIRGLNRANLARLKIQK